MDKQPKKHINPYLAGFFLGLVLLAANFISGRGLGSSGAVKSVVVSAVSQVAPEHAKASPYYSKYIANGKSPMKSWLVFLTLGVIVGSFFSGVKGHRLQLRVEHGPNWTKRKRLITALIGGILFGFGAQMARGCTSGAALSGMAVLSTAGFITMMSIFGTGYVIAYFFRRFWI